MFAFVELDPYVDDPYANSCRDNKVSLRMRKTREATSGTSIEFALDNRKLLNYNDITLTSVTSILLSLRLSVGGCSRQGEERA